MKRNNKWIVTIIICLLISLNLISLFRVLLLKDRLNILFNDLNLIEVNRNTEREQVVNVISTLQCIGQEISDFSLISEDATNFRFKDICKDRVLVYCFHGEQCITCFLEMIDSLPRSVMESIIIITEKESYEKLKLLKNAHGINNKIYVFSNVQLPFIFELKSSPQLVLFQNDLKVRGIYFHELEKFGNVNIGIKELDT